MKAKKFMARLQAFLHFPQARIQPVYGKKSIHCFIHLEGRLLSGEKLFKKGRLIDGNDREALQILAEKVGMPAEEVNSNFALNTFLSDARKILKKRLKGKKP